MSICIGLFGTCDNVRWRDPFMKEFEAKGIEYFNPMVDDWKPELAAIEAQHLREDPIILFPVLSASYGQGSLSEMGFGPLRAMRQNANRSFVVLIDETLDEHLDDAACRKDSLRSRKLVKTHLLGLNLPNVYVVENLDKMLEAALKLHVVHQQFQELELMSVSKVG